MKYLAMTLFLLFSNQVYPDVGRFQSYQLDGNELFLPKEKELYLCDFDVNNVVSFYAGNNAYSYTYFPMQGVESQLDSVWRDIKEGNYKSRLVSMIIPISGHMKALYTSEHFLYLSRVDGSNRQRVMLSKSKNGIIIGQEYLEHIVNDKSSCAIADKEDVIISIGKLMKE